MGYIIGISVYLLSVYLLWRYYKIACSEGGIWSTLSPNLGSVIFIFLPIFNTIGVITWYLMGSPKKDNQRNYNKFFKIKK